MRFCMLFSMAFCFFCTMQELGAGELQVETDFQGGSAQVLEINQESRSVTIRPAGDAQRGWPCWWYFRLTGVEPGETVTIMIDGNGLKRANGRRLGSDWALPSQAAFSEDGKSWTQTSVSKPVNGKISWQQPVSGNQAWFAWGPPFTPEDAEALVNRLDQEHTHATKFELCKTREGRTVPALVITEQGTDDGEKMVVWIQARQHAWESGGSWVGRGFAEWLTSDDPRAKTLRQKIVVYYVPIMDIDNVATGNGGKEQIPNDHNRDWHEAAHWNSVKAAMSLLTAFDKQNRLTVFVDLHNPGSREYKPYFFISPPELVSPLRRACETRFVAACRKEIVAPLPLDDKMKPTGASYDPLWKRISGNWIKFNTQDYVIGLTLETCWNTPHSNIIGYSAVGRQLGLGIERYLRSDPRKSSATETKSAE